MTIDPQTLSRAASSDRSAAQLVDDLAGKLREAGVLLEALQKISSELATAPMAYPSDLISAGAAAKLAGVTKRTVCRWCKEQPIERPGGFGFRRNKHHQVSRAPFVIWLTRQR